MSPILSAAYHLLSCRWQSVPLQRNFCSRSWCTSVEQPVSCEKMKGDKDDHARRLVECQQTGMLVPLKWAIGVRNTQS